MALRRSSGSILKVGSSARRSRGSGSSFSTSSIAAPRLYDMEYRQMTEDYRDEIISYDEYISFLNYKLERIGDEHDHFTISKRIKDVTTAYNKKAESEWKSEAKLEEQKYAEDYRNGLIGFEAFYPYMQEKAEYFCLQDPNSSECFMATKKADDVMFQQVDREMDFKFKVSKTVEPDDYISWKENQLEGLDPNSNAYMQLQTDIKSAKKEKTSRERNQLEFDILIGEKNKQDLISFYNEQAQNSTDPETQMKYFTLSSNTTESLNKELEAEWRKERALEEKEWALKFRRGDLGNTAEENIQAYHNFMIGQYESEHDASRQMTYLSKLDSLEKQAEDIYEGRIKKAAAAGAAAEKEAKAIFKAKSKEVTINIKKAEKALDRGEITPEEFAMEMWEIMRGEEGFEAEVIEILNNAGTSDGLYEDAFTEYDKINEKYETEGFWKAYSPEIDSEGKWTGELNSNPNFKAIAKFDDNGNYKVSYLHDPDQSYDLEGYIHDKEAGLYRKYETVKTKDEKGNIIETKELFMPDKDGNMTKISFDEKTGDWMNERTGKAQGNFWDKDFSHMNPDELKAYLQEIGDEKTEKIYQAEFDSGKKGMLGEGLTGKAWDVLTGAVEGIHRMQGESAAKGGIYKAGADIGSGIKKTVGRMAEEGPADTARRILGESKEYLSGRAGELPEAMKTDWNNLGAFANKKIGEFGEDIKKFQEDVGMKVTSGYWGPSTQKAYDKVAQQLAPSVEKAKEEAGQVWGDVGKITGAIGSAAQNIFAPQTAQAQNQIGGALGNVYAKRSDLQQHFDASGKGISAAWKGHTIQDWAERHGSKEEITLKGFKKSTPIKSQFQFKAPTLGAVKKTTKDFTKPWRDLYGKVKATAWKAPQAVRSRVTSDFSKQKFSRLGSDVGTIKKYTSKKVSNIWNKFKWW